MKVSRTLMKKIFPMFLSLVLIIGLVGVNVKATVTDEPQNDVQEEIIDTDEGNDQGEAIDADDPVDEEPIIDDETEEAPDEEITDEEPVVIEDEEDADEVTEEDPVIEAAEDEEVYDKLTIKKTWDLTAGGDTSDLTFEIKVYENAEAENPLFTVPASMEKKDGTEWTVDVSAPEPEVNKFNKAYIYKLDENPVENFEKSEPVFDDGTFEITNTYVDPGEDPYDYITINKTWDLTAGGKTSALSFDINVYENEDDEEPLFDVPVLMEKQEGNEWTVEVKALDGQKFNKDYTYKLEEEIPDGFEITDLEFDDGTFEIVNTYSPDVPPTEYKKIKVSKIWDLTKGGSASDITFTLYQDGKEYDKVTLKAKDYVTEAEEDAEEEDADPEAEVQRVYEWETSFSPKSGDTFTAEHEYTLLESGASADFDVSGLTDFDDTEGSFTVTNTYNPGSDDTFSIFVRKYWSGGTAEVMNLNIYQDVKPGEGQPYLTYELYAETCAEEDGSWYFQIDNLPRGHEYYMSESATGYTGSTPVIITENGLKGWKVTNTYTGGGTGTNDTTTVDTTSAKTGDNNNLIIYIVILLVAAVAVVGALIYKKKNK